MKNSSIFDNNSQYLQSLSRSHIVDSVFFGDGFSTEESRKILNDLARMQRWLYVEVALAESQADINLIPKRVARKLAKTGKIELFDLENIKKEVLSTGHSLMPLLREWQNLVDEETKQYIHYGATTQDIQDTAQILAIRDIINIVERDLKEIIIILTNLSKKYRNLVMIGRTHGQHALPTTLGLKIAGWLDESMRNYQRLKHCSKNVLVAQLFGGVGTMAAFSDKGIKLLKCFSKKLKLGCPKISWHNSRDRLVELLTTFALIVGTFGKIANEIIQLGKNGIDELSEPFRKGQLGSSTMPHKKNPEICERIVLLAKLVKNNAGLSFDTLWSEHERDYRCIRIEWITITDASLYTCCTLALTKAVLCKLTVHHHNICRNVENSKEFILTEAIMYYLWKKIGKHEAYQIVYDASMCAAEKRSSFLEELLLFPQVNKNFNKQELEKIMNPSNYIGLAGKLVDNVVACSSRSFNLNKK